MNVNNFETVSIETKDDFFGLVRDTAVVAVDENETTVRFETEGEGRATRYFMNGEKAKKADVEATFEAFVGHDEIDFVVPKERDLEHGTIACRYCGAELGYLTGSHMKSHDGGPQTIAQYRAMVAEQDGVDPEEVPIAPEEMDSRFEQWGAESASADYDYSEEVRRRWEEGEYDHLRAEDEDEGDDEDEQEVEA